MRTETNIVTFKSLAIAFTLPMLIASSGAASGSPSTPAPPANGTAPAGGKWHPMKVWVEMSPLEEFKNAKNSTDAYNILTKNLLPSIIEHFVQTYEVFGADNVTLLEKKCASIPSIGNYLNKSLNGDLFIFLNSTNKKEDFIVKGTACQFDKSSGRPIAMELLINIYHKDDFKPSYMDYLYELSLRELYTALAFDTKYFDQFVAPGTTTKVKKEEVVKDFPSSPFKAQIVMHPVLEYAKTHYKCPTLEGMPLENHGAVSAQWEKIVAANELMGAKGYTNPSFSNLTLSFMMGTGWYKPKEDLLETFSWGQEAGCDLFTGNCTKIKYSCTEKAHICSEDFTSIGTCEKDTEAEGCPFYQESKNGDCRVHDNLDKSSGVANSLFYGTAARCIVGKIGFDKITQTDEMANCMNAKCKDGKEILIEIEGQNVTCTKAGEHIPYIKGGPRYIVCPDPVEFCAKSSSACPKDCNFSGRCLATKKCWCFQGFKGDDCSTANPTNYKYNTLNGLTSTLILPSFLLFLLLPLRAYLLN